MNQEHTFIGTWQRNQPPLDKVELSLHHAIIGNFKQMLYTVYMKFMALMDDLCGCFGMHTVQRTLLTDQTRIAWLIYSFIELH